MVLIYHSGYILDDCKLLVYGYSHRCSSLDAAFDFAVDQTGANNVFVGGQILKDVNGKRRGVLMMYVTDASTEERERICKELDGVIISDLITFPL